MSTTPTLSPPIIGQAENAHKAILNRILAPTGITMNQWVALTLTTANGSSIESRDLQRRMTSALKIDEAEAVAAVAQLTTAQLMKASGNSLILLTDAGQARYREIRAAVSEVVARAYGGIPAEELETAGRVLAVITARLNSELDNGE